MARRYIIRVGNNGYRLLFKECLSPIQPQLAQARVNEQVDDLILVLEHPHVITIGTSGGEHNILVSPDTLAREKITTVYTDRGGDVMYHGPGQLVCYLIFDLRNVSFDIHQYIRNLEEVTIRVLSNFSLSGRRIHGYAGVWVGDRKICAIGVRISRGVTSHGFALNVNPDLKHFSYIYPCGIRDKSVTSIGELVGHQLGIEAVTPLLLKHLSEVLDMDIEQQPPECLMGIYPSILNSGLLSCTKR